MTISQDTPGLRVSAQRRSCSERTFYGPRAMFDAIRAHLYPEVSAQVMGVTPSRKWLERQDWAHPVLAEPFRIEDGSLHIPESAGNGITWDEEAVRHYATDA